MDRPLVSFVTSAALTGLAIVGTLVVFTQWGRVQKWVGLAFKPWQRRRRASEEES